MNPLWVGRTLLGETLFDEWIGRSSKVALAQTLRDVVLREGRAELLRFRGKRPALGGTTTSLRSDASAAPPMLFIPSMLHRWYVLDLRPGASLAEALVAANIDTYCLNWGETEDEDRYLTWADLQKRIGRAVRKIKALTGAKQVVLLGYSMGASLAAIYAANHPDDVCGLVNLAGPIDFSRAGTLRTLVDPKWFNPTAISAAGNVSPEQLEAGIRMLRPTMQLTKSVELLSEGLRRKRNEDALRTEVAIEMWAEHELPVPADVYRTYITELYQANELFLGTHRVGGVPVDLMRIRCPVLTVAAESDSICPLASARALHERVGSKKVELLMVPGGHVGAVVGPQARETLYPKIVRFVREESVQA